MTTSRIRESIHAASTQTDDEWARATVEDVADAIAIGSRYDSEAAYHAARAMILSAGYGWTSVQEVTEARVVDAIQRVFGCLNSYFNAPGGTINLYDDGTPRSIKNVWEEVRSKGHLYTHGPDRRLRTRYVTDLIAQDALQQMRDAYSTARREFEAWVDAAPDVESESDPAWIEWVEKRPR